MVCGVRVCAGVFVCMRVCVCVYTVEFWSSLRVLESVVHLLKLHLDGVWCAVCGVWCVCVCACVCVCVCVHAGVLVHKNGVKSCSVPSQISS